MSSLDAYPNGWSNLKIRPLPHTDNRTDDEIVYAILNPPPVTTEENVWAFWDKGYNAMHPWQKRNVLCWARLLGPAWTVRVLDITHESSANIFNFIEDADLPEHLGTKHTRGHYAGAHISDTIRLLCIFQHGGVWMDVGIMLLMHLDQVCWTALKSPKSKYQVALASGDPTLKSGMAENFFIAARKGNGFIERWMLIVLETWAGRASSEGVHKHPLFDHLVRDGNIAPFLKGAVGDKLDYFHAYLAFERLRLLEDPYDGFSGPSYCKNRILLIDYKEFAAGAMLTNDNGMRQLKLFNTRYDQNQDSEEYREADEFFTYILSNAAMLKQYHWRDHDVPTLADLWDRPENYELDAEPNTFGAYLRYISSHYTQDRAITVVKFPPMRENVLVAGVLETFDP